MMPPRQGSGGSQQRSAGVEEGFNITNHLREICENVAWSVPELSHIDVTQVAFAFAQARKAVMHGMQASLTPMRFKGGALTGDVRGRRMTVQRLYDADGDEMLYIYTVYLPRFMNLDFHEKLVTIFHELWHIGERFDGDIRRHPGRCYAHSHSQKDFDAHMAVLVDRWLGMNPPSDLYRFLELDFTQLEQQFGRVYGLRIARPRLLAA